MKLFVVTDYTVGDFLMQYYNNVLMMTEAACSSKSEKYGGILIANFQRFRSGLMIEIDWHIRTR